MKDTKFKKLTKREKQILLWTVIGAIGLILFAVIVIKGVY